MSVLILGVDLPAEGEIKEIILHHDGKAHEYYKNRMHKAVPVPPHGRLIDADALMEYIKNALGCYGNETQIKTTFGTILDYIKARINDAPTIIPEEEG